MIALTNASGSVIGINSYDDYGIPASTNIGRFRYAGQQYLSDLGFYHYKARIYSPTLGRFLQADPIGYGDGMNIYAYVGSDPINGIDPTGLGCVGLEGYQLHCPPRLSDDSGGLARSTVGYTSPVGGGNFGGGGGGGTRKPPPAQQEEPPQNDKPCDAPLSTGVGSPRAGLEATALGADVATGIGGPVAIGTKLFGYGVEAALAGAVVCR